MPSNFVLNIENIKQDLLNNIIPNRSTTSKLRFRGKNSELSNPIHLLIFSQV